MARKKSNKIYLSLIIVPLLGFLVGGCAIFVKKDHPRQSTATEEKNEETAQSAELTETVAKENVSELLPRQIDGVLVSPEKTNDRPSAVMIDNMIDSRPPAGLSKANLVYEAVAESDITRFLAVFTAGEAIEKIGPVRSARPYFIDWAEELKALYAHCGGSPAAIKNLAAGKYEIYNLDQYYEGNYFWRDKKRYAPHNLYASSELLNQARENKKIDNVGDYQSWLFKEGALPNDRPLVGEEKNLKIHFSADSSHLVKWQYDRENNDYLRYQQNEIHQDADGSPIRAKNVVVQFVKTVVLDSYGRLATQTIGEGKAVIFQDGLAIEGRWKKTARGERTKFFDQKDNEIKFNRGTTWIEAVPTGKTTEY